MYELSFGMNISPHSTLPVYPFPESQVGEVGNECDKSISSIEVVYILL